MGNGLSSSTPGEDLTIYEDTSDIFSEAALARKAERIRNRFPIVISTDNATLLDHAASISPDAPSLLTKLPPELVEQVVNHLDNRSAKNLRLTCRFFSTIRLRINRVFLSTNLLDIQVFRSIAGHDVYRQGIIEIIYDDARLCPSFTEDNSDIEILSATWIDGPTEVEWFQVERDENLDELENRQSSDDLGHPEHLRRALQAQAELSFEESWSYYQNLLHEQGEVIACGADVEALRYGLRRFPALRRVTVTPAAYGLLFTPLYETPTIRALPYGFNSPIPRGWPTRRDGCSDVFSEPWEDTKARWRGFNIIVKTLAEEQHHHHLTEFLVDSHYLGTGLNCRLFERPCQEYSDLLSILQRPYFKKLHLSLNVDAQQESDHLNWTSFRSSLMRNAIAEASQLEHFSMETNWNDLYSDDVEPPSLRTFLPIDHWTELQHFGLWNFPVNRADLISTLSQLPGLRSLELGFLEIYSGNHRELLNDMRGSLRWHERLVKPKIKFAIPTDSRRLQALAIWLDKDVEKFLYHDGENPFLIEYGNQVDCGVGIKRDAFDPAYEIPN